MLSEIDGQDEQDGLSECFLYKIMNVTGDK